MKTPEQIANIIPLIFQQEHQWKYELLRNWQDIFGNLSGRVRLESINKDILVLAVSDACLMQELYTLSPVLLTAINQVLDKPYIQHLRFKRAGIRQPRKQCLERYVIPIPTSSILLSPKEQKIISSIQDSQLAQVLKDFLIRCYREREMYNNTSKSVHK